MQRYIAGRLAQALACMIVITMIVFVIVRLSGDPVLLMLPAESTEQDRHQMQDRLGLNEPLHVQYALFLGNLIRGDFGYSYRWSEPALSLIGGRLPATMELTAAAMLVAILIGLPVGIMSAVRRDSLFDTVGKSLALVGQSLPTFWVGIMAILLFSAGLRLLPAGGRGQLSQLIMPAVCLGLYPAAAIVRLTRSSMLDVLGSEYIKLARIKGVTETFVILKHALKNAAIPVVTMLGLQIGAFLGGAVVTETVFSWPGVGRQAVDAIFSRDFPVVQAAVIVTSAMFISINLLVDVIYAYLDPRIRYK